MVLDKRVLGGGGWWFEWVGLLVCRVLSGKVICSWRSELGVPDVHGGLLGSE